MKKPWIIAAVIGLATSLLYLPILRNGFVTWDDGDCVFNPSLWSLDLNLLRFAVGFRTPNWYPLTWIVHALDHALWGLNPVGHHATSILLQTVNTVLLFFVVLALLAARGGARSGDAVAGYAGEVPAFGLTVAGATSLLFGIHPTHVESVAWASGKKDLLCTFFLLLTVYAHARYVARERACASARPRGMANPWYPTSVAAFLLAVLSKSSAVTFPLVLLMLDVYPFDRLQSGSRKLRLIVEKIPFVLLSFAVAATTYFAHATFGDLTGLADVGVTTRLLVSAKAAAFYLVHLLWPVGLLPFYPYPENASIRMPPYLLSVTALALISVVCVLLKRRRVLMAVWLYFLVTLVPVIGLVKMGFQEMADRYAYLPSIGPILLLALGLSVVVERAASAGRPLRFAGIVAGALLVLSLSLLTIRQARIWKDDLALWNYEIETEPELSWLAYQNRGVALSRAGRLDAALDDYLRAIAMNPRSPELFYNRANMYVRLGRFDEAADDYTTAISLAPQPHPDYFNNRGVVYEILGRHTEAAADRSEAERRGRAIPR